MAPDSVFVAIATGSGKPIISQNGVDFILEPPPHIELISVEPKATATMAANCVTSIMHGLNCKWISRQQSVPYAGLDSGADDYLTKPFHMKELSARVRAVLRRPGNYVGDKLSSGALELDPGNHCVKVDGNEVSLLPKEFALLEFLMRHPDQVFSADALLNRVWASASDSSIDALTTCVKRLRKKIDKDGQPSYIKTVHGVGYKLYVAD